MWPGEVEILLGGRSAHCSSKGGGRPESPVYEVTSESKTKKPRTLHRNMLLPCDYLSYEPVVPKVSQEQRCQKRPPNYEVSGDDLLAGEEEFPSVSRRLILESTDNIVESDALVVENERIELQGKDGIESDEMEIRSDVDETPDVMEEQNAAIRLNINIYININIYTGTLTQSKNQERDCFGKTKRISRIPRIHLNRFELILINKATNSLCG